MATRFHVSLNEDLWIEIFKSLTIEFLCKIRCVCKSWNSIISSSVFINHHFSLTNSDHSTKSNIVFSSSENNTYIDDSYSIYNPQDFGHVQQLNFTKLFFRSEGSKYYVIDVVNGVVCLSQSKGANKFTLSNILWNPTIHVFIEIPGSSNPFEEKFITKGWRVIGFGFDSRRNEFKIVRMNNATWLNESLTFEVFSTREGSREWRSLTTDFGPFTLVSQCGCFKNGSIHWIVKSQNLYRLLMFDCEREEFKTMEIPKKFNRDGFGNLKPLFLGIHRGMLLLVASNAEIWVMEEYGVAKSWKKSKSKITDFVMFEGKSVMNLVGGTSSGSLKWRRIRALRKFHQPLIGCYDLQPSLFLMDARKVDIETKDDDDEDWKVGLFS